MKKVLAWFLVVTVLTACFVVGFFALSVMKEEKESKEVVSEVSKIDEKIDEAIDEKTDENMIFFVK